MKRIAQVMTMLVLAAGLAAAHANEAAIRKALEPKMGGVKIDAVTPSPIPGLFEVQYRSGDGAQVVYVDPTGNYVIQGNIMDLRSGKDVTEEKLRKLNAIKFEQLPLDQAVKVQRGSGKRVVAMFSDPYCPYCQQFEKALQEVTDITVYVFMFPIIRRENEDHSKSVWCSPDRAKAWLDLALYHRRPSASPACDNPVNKNLQLGQQLRITGTPTLIFPNGERVSGAMRPADFREMLDRSQTAGAGGPPAARAR